MDKIYYKELIEKYFDGNITVVQFFGAIKEVDLNGAFFLVAHRGSIANIEHTGA